MTARMALQRLFLWACLVIAGGTVTVAEAGSLPQLASSWQRDDAIEVRLVAATTTLADSGKVVLAIEMRLQPDWQVYWRAPGDSGLPTRAKFDGSSNLAGAEILYPLPRRFTKAGDVTFGYHDAVLFPIVARAVDATSPLDLTVHLSYGLCLNICMPMKGSFTLRVPAFSGQVMATADAAHIEVYRRRVPDIEQSRRLRLVSATLVDGNDGLQLDIAIESMFVIGAPDAFVDGPPSLAFGKPAVLIDADGKRARLRLPVSGPKAGALVGMPLRIIISERSIGAIEAMPTVQGPPVVN